LVERYVREEINEDERKRSSLFVWSEARRQHLL
jgi:hypothetical protein